MESGLKWMPKRRALQFNAPPAANVRAPVERPENAN
jgi:hypothetical protein